MASVYQAGNTWTVTWFDSQGKRQYARGLPTKALADQIAQTREFHRHAAKHGIIDPLAERQIRHADTLLETHLGDFRKAMRAKRDTEQYIRETLALVRRVFAAVGIQRIDQIDRFKIQVGVAGLSPQRAVKGGTLSVRSQNKALAACRAFAGWLFDVNRAPHNVLARMHEADPETDRRRVRDPLDADEFTALFNAALAGKIIGGMTGEDRAIRYLLGTATGFRQGTLFTLTPESFCLDEHEPYVWAEPKNVKNRKRVSVPVDPDLAAVLRPWLAGRKPGYPVFAKSKGAVPMDAYKIDLKAAGIEYHAAGTARYTDQHSQRNAFITEVIRRGGLKVAQDLAGHSTPVLTSKYARLGMSDYAGAVKGLVKLPKAQKKDGKKTG
jgi:site-specific recombinase XerC